MVQTQYYNIYIDCLKIVLNDDANLKEEGAREQTIISSYQN